MPLSDKAVSHLRDLMDAPAQLPERYVAQEIVGSGGMGTVWRAYDTVLARDVAVKVLENPGLNASRIDERLQREAMVLARLEHPGIVPVHDAGVLADGRPYYVMRLVRGVRLDEHAASGIGRGELLRILLRVCESVAFANAEGVVHRDLKPGNVMIGPFGEVLVLDWGVAKLLNETAVAVAGDARPNAGPDAADSTDELTRDGTVIGTPGYMSPEQEMGASATVSQRADVFGLGAMLRELLRLNGAQTNRALQAIVARATAPAPEARYASALLLAQDIQHWLDGNAVAAYRENILERTLRTLRQHQVAVLLVAMYLVVRTVILLWRHI